MYHFNMMPNYRKELEPQDAAVLGNDGADEVARLLAIRENNTPTPLHVLPGLARELGLSSLHIKDEGYRLGLGSFKALGGAYALMKLVQDAAALQLNHPVAAEDLMSPAVRSVVGQMTFACATDGNHGRSVAQGAQLMGANAVIFVPSGVSEGRIKAIARFGARVVRVKGNYDDSVAECARVAKAKNWTILSDTSLSGSEYIPGLVMQGYTVLVREALADIPSPPTHVFLQAGVGGFAAAVAGHLAMVMGDKRPHVTVVEPARAACLYESAILGRPMKVAQTGPTIMAMLECYEPSLVAFRVLERVADGFMIVEEDTAPEVMRRLAHPSDGDPPIVAGESGGVGLAGLLAVLRKPDIAKRIGLGPQARILVVNTEGATDPVLYEKIVGRTSDTVLKGVAK